MPEFDYRKILLAYISWVGEREGRTYLEGSMFRWPCPPSVDIPGLSPEESVELAKIRDVENDNPDTAYYDPDGNPYTDEAREAAIQARDRELEEADDE